MNKRLVGSGDYKVRMELCWWFDTDKSSAKRYCVQYYCRTEPALQLRVTAPCNRSKGVHSTACGKVFLCLARVIYSCTTQLNAVEFNAFNCVVVIIIIDYEF